ncbi:APC family permease [Pseudonocardiaceae bacterium YIM PH 21723]|nr:APC family permease [Pseudonocardiaceae bacterium YIM PH 21723]
MAIVTDEQGRTGLRAWLLDGLPPRGRRGLGPHAAESRHDPHPWWKVMCLTGVDYFSTLGYQPGIAALAAGALSPIATLVLVAITLLGALPVYRRVAVESPNGQGSISMLERMLSQWKGKILVLALLGFMATDFVITITLSAADATAHIVENPFVDHLLDGTNVVITLALIVALGAVFLIGFTEAIGIAVVLVGVYLVLNLVVVITAVLHLLEAPHVIADWQNLLVAQHGSPWLMIAVALVVFPKLALGLSGFETGVAVMPLVDGDRVRNTRKLLTVAALIMSGFLIASSFLTTVLIPAHEFKPGGEANGRALAYLAHQYLGDFFGTAYDLSTILILWFAGASAMAGLLNIIPKYLPRYGMAPDWARAVRPLVLVVTAVAAVITVIFKASVDAQGGAYATGVLALIFSATIAVTLSARRRGSKMFWAYLPIMLAFGYTFVLNIVERSDGLKIAAIFIVMIITVSLISRAMRSTELRATEITFDPLATQLIEQHARGTIRIIANEPDERDLKEYVEKEAEQREDAHIPTGEPVLFLEVTVLDASEFESDLQVEGEERFGYHILKVSSSSVPNTIAAILLQIRDMTGQQPHIYFAWMEGNPVSALFRYLFLGGGDVAPLTREVLRQAERDPERRPLVHVG